MVFLRTRPDIFYIVTRSDIIIHPGWYRSTMENDISLIRITSVSYSATIDPVALPKISSSNPNYDGEAVIASGWGRTSDSSLAGANDLQYGKMTVISNSVCRRTFISITDSNICVSTSGGVSTCQGDSGGPLVLAYSKVQIGLTSFGSSHGCALCSALAFTRITSYLSWIKENTGISG